MTKQPQQRVAKQYYLMECQNYLEIMMKVILPYTQIKIYRKMSHLQGVRLLMKYQSTHVFKFLTTSLNTHQF